MNRHNYPGISDILARKAEGRKRLAALSFGQKIAMLEEMRARVAPFIRARNKRRLQTKPE